MKAHPAIPHAQQLPGDKAVAREAGKGAGNAGLSASIERGISKASAKDYTQRAIEEQIIRVALRHWRAGLLYHAGQMPIGKQHAQQVRHRVKPQHEATGKRDARLQAQVGPIDRITSSSGK